MKGTEMLNIYIALHRKNLENNFLFPRKIAAETKGFSILYFLYHIFFLIYSVHLMAVHTMNR